MMFVKILLVCLLILSCIGFRVSGGKDDKRRKIANSLARNPFDPLDNIFSKTSHDMRGEIASYLNEQDFTELSQLFSPRQLDVDSFTQFFKVSSFPRFMRIFTKQPEFWMRKLGGEIRFRRHVHDKFGAVEDSQIIHTLSLTMLEFPLASRYIVMVASVLLEAINAPPLEIGEHQNPQVIISWLLTDPHPVSVRFILLGRFRARLDHALDNNDHFLAKLLVALPETWIPHSVFPHQISLNLYASKAAEKGYIDIVLRLIKWGADLNDLEMNPLKFAVAACHHELTRILIEKGSLLKRTENECETTVLHSLASTSTPDCFETLDVLIEQGADIDQMNNDHKTLLYIAASNSNSQLVSHLLENGADPSIPGPQQLLPVDIATGAILEVLRNYELSHAQRL